jgi:hypothetical protein
MKSMEYKYLATSPTQPPDITPLLLVLREVGLSYHMTISMYGHVVRILRARAHACAIYATHAIYNVTNR